MKIIPIQRWYLTVLLLVASQPPAWAHAFLDHADPKVGSATNHPPAEIKLWFTQNLEPAFSSMEVQDARAQKVDKKDSCTSTPSDKLVLIVSVPPLPAGTYTVTWHAVSVDTHKTQGHL